jgi:hypothetical protein
MNVREHLKRESTDVTRLVKQIVFEGERLDVMSLFETICILWIQRL